MDQPNVCRCGWCNLTNQAYIDYHDREWGIPTRDDHALFELLLLENFQAGLSWECVLNKRESFRRAFDRFDLDRVCGYGEADVQRLLSNPGIIRNQLKIRAAITNARVFRAIGLEYGSFSSYIWHFTKGRILYETGKSSSGLSDQVSGELRKRGMKFVGTTIVYSYLQAIGVINSHEERCFLYRSGRQ